METAKNKTKGKKYKNDFIYCVVSTMNSLVKKSLSRCCVNLCRKNFQFNQKFNFSKIKIYSDGLVNAEFSNEFKTITEGVKIPIFRILDNKGDLVNGNAAPFTDEETLQIYKSMVEFSVYDEILYAVQRQGRIHFYIVNEGEEGLQFGVGKALKLSDHIYSQYREAGVLYTRGHDLSCFLHQLYGTKYDESKGRQICVSYLKKDLNIHAITTPLASQLLHAAGCGYALKLKKEKSVAAAFCGEGAASEGDFYASLNFASVRGSQVMFFCKNNLYAISTHVKDQYRGDGVAPRAVALGIETIRVDGLDLFASYVATKKMREICVNESKPVFIEFINYRYGHHSTSDNSNLYRPDGELESWNEEGVRPISRLFLYLKKKNLITDQEDQLIRKQAKQYVLKELNKMESVKRYNISKGLFDDVYANVEWNIKEQQEGFENFFKKYKKYYDAAKHEN